MEEFTHKVQLEDFLGLDLTSNDLKRPDNFLTGGQNFDVDDNGDLVSRKGYHRLASSQFFSHFPNITANFFGLGDSSAGAIEGDLKREVIHIGSGFYAIRSRYIELTNNNAFSVRVICGYDAGAWKIRLLKESDQSVLYSATFPISIATIQTGLSGQSVASTTDWINTADTVALRPVNQLIKASGVVRIYGYEERAAQPGSGVSTNTGFLSSSTLINNVLYFSQQDGTISKYDGMRYYRAGLPKPVFTSYSTATGGAGFLEAGDYTYKARYVHRDNAGNYIYGPFSDEFKVTVPGVKTHYVILNVSHADYQNGGYKNIRGDVSTATPQLAITAGSNFTVTTSFHNLMDGDIVHWWNKSSTRAKVFEDAWEMDVNDLLNFGRVISTVGSTSVTIKPQQSGYFTYADSIISPCVYLEVYRTNKAAVDPAQSTFYLVGVPPVDDSTDFYNDRFDNTSANFLSSPLAPEVTSDYGNLIFKSRYLSNYKGRLVATGDTEDPNIVHFSEAGFPENFPTATNSFVTDTEFGDESTGISGNQDALLIFKNSTVHRVTGDLGGIFSLERIYSGIGCLSHNSIAEIGESRTVFLTPKGFYQVVRSSAVIPLMPIEGISGEVIDRMAGYFRNPKSGDLKMYLEAAQAQTYPHENKYILTVPKATDDGSTVTDSYHFTAFDYIVFDYKKGYYSIWNGLNSYGGFRTIQIDDVQHDLIFMTTTFGSGYFLAGLSKSDLPQDYLDHLTAISTELKFNWMHLGRPDVLKKFLRGNLWILGNDGSSLTAETEINWDSTTTSTLALIPYESTDTNVKFKMSEQRAKALRLIISHSEPLKRLRLPGFTLEVVAPFKPRLKE